MFDPLLFFKFDESRVYSPVPGSQIMGKAQKSGEDAKVKGARRPSSPQFPPFFCVRALSISAGPIISVPGTGYVSTVYAHCIFVVIGSLLLNIRLHSILNKRKKKVREEEKS